MTDKPKLIHECFYFKDWMAPNPDSEVLANLLWKGRYNFENLTQSEMYSILGLAEAYVHFAGHVAPNYMIIDQLRQLRSAVRENRKTEEEKCD